MSGLIFTVEYSYLNEWAAKRDDLFPYTRNLFVLQWREEDGFTYERLRTSMPAATEIMVTEMA